jgi:endonuclease/exonuclease/phosphatase family metal-dependent hydrolase
VQKEQPDVLALQEVFKERLPDIVRETKMRFVSFYPMHTNSNIVHPKLTDTTLGVAVFSNVDVENVHGVYYVGEESIVPRFIYSQNPNSSEISDTPNNSNLVLACGDFKKDGESYRVLTTHFTYTRDGVATAFQLAHLDLLFQKLENIGGDFILTGDFNAPRGRETWNRLAAKYADNIPLSYTSSLDPILHKAAAQKFPYVVDGCFTTSGYKAKEVRLVSGVSDHMAIVAHIEHV